MNRLSKGCLLALVWCSLMGYAHAAKPGESGQKSAQPPQTPPQQQAQQTPQAAADAPSIQIAETTFDFGNVGEGSEVSHDFTVKNTGKTALQIDQVRPG